MGQPLTTDPLGTMRQYMQSSGATSILMRVTEELCRQQPAQPHHFLVDYFALLAPPPRPPRTVPMTAGQLADLRELQSTLCSGGFMLPEEMERLKKLMSLELSSGVDAAPTTDARASPVRVKAAGERSTASDIQRMTHGHIMTPAELQAFKERNAELCASDEEADSLPEGMEAALAAVAMALAALALKGDAAAVGHAAALRSRLAELAKEPHEVDPAKRRPVVGFDIPVPSASPHTAADGAGRV